MLERLGEEDELALAAEEDGPRRGDPLDEEVAGVLERGQAAGVRARGWPIERRRRAPVERLVRPLLVEEAPERVEGALLGDDVGAWRLERIAFERLVHALMGAVLLRMRGQNALVLNP